MYDTKHYRLEDWSIEDYDAKHGKVFLVHKSGLTKEICLPPLFVELAKREFRRGQRRLSERMEKVLRNVVDF